MTTKMNYRISVKVFTNTNVSFGNKKVSTDKTLVDAEPKITKLLTSSSTLSIIKDQLVTAGDLLSEVISKLKIAGPFYDQTIIFKLDKVDPTTLLNDTDVNFELTVNADGVVVPTTTTTTTTLSVKSTASAKGPKGAKTTTTTTSAETTTTTKANP